MAERELTTKIAFVGAASVGKTTLLNELRGRHRGNPKVGFVDEVGRKFFQENPTSEADMFSFGVQARLQDLILLEEKKVHATKPEIIICDRSVLDSPVHLRAHEDYDAAEMLVERVKDWIPTYSSFVLLDATGVPFKNDKVRIEGVDTRRKIQGAFLDFFRENNFPYELLSGTVYERAARVENILNIAA